MWKLYPLTTETHRSHLLSTHVVLLRAGCQALPKIVSCVKCSQASACPSAHVPRQRNKEACPDVTRCPGVETQWAQSVGRCSLATFSTAQYCPPRFSGGTAITPLVLSYSSSQPCFVVDLLAVSSECVYQHHVLLRSLHREYSQDIIVTLDTYKLTCSRLLSTF